MPSATECRENAEESLCLAKTAKSERECSIYLQIAHTWLLAAAKLEGRALNATPHVRENANSGNRRPACPFLIAPAFRSMMDLCLRFRLRR